jgi:hypothetical protein
MFCASLVPGVWSKEYASRLQLLQRTLAAGEASKE